MAYAPETRLPTDLAKLLRRADQADPQAADELFAALYGELHRLAERQLERNGGSLTLGTTTLVHDAYLSMIGRRDAQFPDRARFFAYASRAMRGLVIDYSRRRRAKKRGRDYEITLVEEEVSAPAVLEAGQDLVFPAQVVDEVTEFMKALTDPAARNLQSIVPNRVPSRIPVDGARGGPGRED